MIKLNEKKIGEPVIEAIKPGEDEEAREETLKDFDCPIYVMRDRLDYRDMMNEDLRFDPPLWVICLALTPFAIVVVVIYALVKMGVL